MAKSNHIRIPVSLFWPETKKYRDEKTNSLNTELKTILRAKALDILDSEYEISGEAFAELRKKDNNGYFKMPKSTIKKYFSYHPGTGEMFVSVFLDLNAPATKELALVKKAGPVSPKSGITDYLALDFDGNFSDNSPTIKILKSLKAILQSIVTLGDKAGIDLYKEKNIIAGFDSWVEALKLDLEDFYKAQGGKNVQSQEFPNAKLTPVLAISFPTTHSVNAYRSSAAHKVSKNESKIEGLPAGANTYGSPETQINSDAYVEKIGFQNNEFGFIYIKSILFDGSPDEGSLSVEQQLELDYIVSQAPVRARKHFEWEIYSTFVNYIRQAEEIVNGEPISTPGDDPMLVATNLYAFLEMYHYPNDIPVDKLESLYEISEDTEALYKRTTEVVEEQRKQEALADKYSKSLTSLYDQTVNAPFSRMDAIKTLSNTGGEGSLHGAYGSLLSDGFNFDSINEKQSMPWLAYPGNKKMRPSEFISDSTVAQISSGKLLKRIKTIKDIETLIIKRLTIRDLLVMGLTCADRYGSPNINVVERLDKFLTILGSTRVFPVFKTTVPIGDFWNDFTDQVEGVVKVIVEQAVVEFFKEMLVMIATCDVQGVGDQFIKGATDLGDLLANKDGALLKLTDDILTKSIQKSPHPNNLLKAKKKIKELIAAVTENTTPIELRDCLQGNGKPQVLSAIAAALSEQLGIEAGSAAVESALSKMGREDCDLVLLDAKIEGMAATASTEICADFKQALRDKYGAVDEGILNQLINDLPNKDPGTALGFNPDFVLDPCELMKIPDPAGDFMVGTSYDSAFASVKTKFTIELNSFPVYLFDGQPLSDIKSKTKLSFGVDGISSEETTEISNNQAKPKLLEDYKNLLSDKDGSLIEVVTSDEQQDVRYNSVDLHVKLQRILADSPDLAKRAAKEWGSHLSYDRAVAALSFKKKIDPQSLENTELVGGLKYDKEIILRNKSYSNLSSDGLTGALISFTGLQSIDINKDRETLALRISTPTPSGLLKDALESLDTAYGPGTVEGPNVADDVRASSQSERFSQVMTSNWKDILGKIDGSYAASFRKAMRIHYPVALDTFAGRFTRKTKYSEFLDADKIFGMGIFVDPLCPDNQKDLLDINGIVSSMETLRKNLICKGVEEQAALRRATLAGLTKTFMRVIVYEKSLPAIFYFSEVGVNDVNKGIFSAFVLSLLSAEVQGGGDDILEIMGSACSDLLTEVEAIEITNTEAFKMVLEQVIVEVSDSVQESINTSKELSIDTDKFGQVTDHILRSILDTPIIESYGVVQEELRGKKITEKSVKLDGRTVYPEILNVPTFMSVHNKEKNQLADLYRFAVYNYNGEKSDDFVEILQDISKTGKITLGIDNALPGDGLGGILESLGLPNSYYDSPSDKLVSLDKQLLKDDNRKRYFEKGGFLLEQFIEVQTKKGLKLKDIQMVSTFVKKINFNSNPLFTSLTADEAISSGVYGQLADKAFDYTDDFLELPGTTPLLNGYVGVDDFYSLATITTNLNDAFAELSQIDKELYDILEEWKEFRYRPTAVPKAILNLEEEDENFKKINGIDSSGNMSVFKTIDSINDLEVTNGHPHVPLGVHRLIAPNTPTAAGGGASFSFYLRGDSLKQTKKSMVKYTPTSFLDFEGPVDVDPDKWASGISAPEHLEILKDTIASFYQVLFKKQGIPLEEYKEQYFGKLSFMYINEAEGNKITLPSLFSATDIYLQDQWLNVNYILKYLNSVSTYFHYEDLYTWDVWEGTPDEGKAEILVGKDLVGGRPLVMEDCYAVFAKIYTFAHGYVFGNEKSLEEHRFHLNQLEYNSEEEKWQLTLKSSLLPRLMLYLQKFSEEGITHLPAKKGLISFLKSADYSDKKTLSIELMGYFNLQYGVPVPEDGTTEKDLWDSVFSAVDVDIKLPFGRVAGLSQHIVRDDNYVDSVATDQKAEGAAQFIYMTKLDSGELVESFFGLPALLPSLATTVYKEVDEVVFNLNAEELYWHFDAVMENKTFYGLFCEKSRGANWIKWLSCKKGYSYYPYELVEREQSQTKAGDSDSKSWLSWRQFSNPDAELHLMKVTTEKEILSPEAKQSSMPMLDIEDINHFFLEILLSDDTTADLILKPSLLFGKVGIHDESTSVTNFSSFGWYNSEMEEGLDLRYHTDYLYEDTSRIGFKVLNIDLDKNALPEKNSEPNEYSPDEYSRIWGLKAKQYPRLKSESYGNMKDWDPNWDGDTWDVLEGIVGGFLESIPSIFGFGFTEEDSPGPKGLLYLRDQFKDMWTDDHGRRRATLDTLLLNIKFYLNQIENYDTLPESHMNDWTALYLSGEIDNIMRGGEGKSIRIGRTTLAGHQYELNGMTTFSGLNARGLDYTIGISQKMRGFIGVANYDCLYGQDYKKMDEATYTPMIKTPLVRRGNGENPGAAIDTKRSMETFSSNLQDAALFATGKAKTSKNNMYSARSLYNYDSEANAYEKILGNQTVGYKLLKNWHDRIEGLRDKRIRILNNLRERVVKFIPMTGGPGGNIDPDDSIPAWQDFFADRPHTDYFKPLKAGIRLSYVLPVIDGTDQFIPSDAMLPKSVLSEMVEAKRQHGGFGEWKWYSPLYRKTYEVVERETKQVTVDDEQVTQTVNKEIYKIPIAEAKIKISDIYGVEDADIPLAFALQTDENENIKYDYDKVYEAIFKLKEELLTDPSFQILFNYSLPVEDLSTLSALGTYNTVINSGRPGMGQMLNKTKRDLLDTMSAFSLPLSYDSAAFIRSYEEQYSFSTTDPIDETGIDAEVIIQAGLMIVKSLAEITDPTVATAKSIKDVSYRGVKASIKAGEAAFGGDASALYNSSKMRYWRSSQAMFPIILSLLPYPLIPRIALAGLGIMEPFHITPVGMVYWALSATGRLDPLDRTLTAASKSDKKCE